MASGGMYLEGATVRLQATFKVSGTETDPNTVTLKVKDPSGTTTSYTYAAGELTKDSTGVYYKDVTPDDVGAWTYRFIGTGAAAGVDEATFEVQPSAID